MTTTPEVMDQMVAEENLSFDAFMRRDPRTLTDEDYLQAIVAARKDRALWNKGQEAKRMKRAGLPETQENDDDTVA